MESSFALDSHYTALVQIMHTYIVEYSSLDILIIIAITTTIIMNHL